MDVRLIAFVAVLLVYHAGFSIVSEGAASSSTQLAAINEATAKARMRLECAYTGRWTVAEWWCVSENDAFS